MESGDREKLVQYFFKMYCDLQPSNFHASGAQRRPPFLGLRKATGQSEDALKRGQSPVARRGMKRRALGAVGALIARRQIAVRIHNARSPTTLTLAAREEAEPAFLRVS